MSSPLKQLRSALFDITTLSGLVDAVEEAARDIQALADAADSLQSSVDEQARQYRDACDNDSPVPPLDELLNYLKDEVENFIADNL